jgi:holo-[acyl-carrier protein] synthase
MARSFDEPSICLGVDILDVDEIRRICAADSGFPNRFLGARERNECEGIEYIAGRFAAKEAISKALRAELKSLSLCEIEVLRGDSGAPSVSVSGGAEMLLDEMRVSELGVSISHKGSYVVAVAWSLREEGSEGLGDD